ncbi:MAG: TonB-dependent receptor [Lacunisphaera sp.]
MIALLAAGRLAAAPVEFSIPAQPAADALPLFIQQSGAEVMYGRGELEGARAQSISGRHEPKEALAILLKDTGLEFTERRPGLFVVKSAPTGAAISTGEVRGTIVRPKLGPSAGLRVVVKETGQVRLTDRDGEFDFENLAAGSYTLIATGEGLQPMHITDVRVRAGRELVLGRETMREAGSVTELEPYVVKGRADEITALDKYVVEGRKEKPFVAGNMDVPRTVNDTQPYYIFDSKTIDQSGAMNIEDFLKQRLTMNTVAQTNSQIGDASNFWGNVSSFNLRGVGSDKTLVLVDGRRMAGVIAGGTDNYQPDLNGIPLSAIDRIEVLPSSASGIYGGSAIGGVINVILKRDYQGGEIRATYDNAWDTDAPRRNVSASYGLSLEGGRTHLMLNAAWSDAHPLLLQDRVDIFRANLADILTRSPTFLYASVLPWLGVLPNISGSTNLVLRNGTPLNSTHTYVPAGTSPNTSAADLAAALLANAGQWNLGFPATSQPGTGLFRPFGVTPETKSFRASLRRQMLPKLELFADFSYDENKSASFYSLSSSYLSIPIGAPNNPFTSSVRVSVPDAGQIPITTNSQSRSATLGLIAQLPWAWTGELDYTWSESHYESNQYAADSTARTADIASGAFNPFVDTLLYPLGFERYVIAEPYAGSNRLHDITLRGSGGLPSLPWGQPNLTVGLEHRIAQTPERHTSVNYSITAINSYDELFYARDSITDSGYAEASVPLVKTDWLPAVHSLDLQLSGRSERYKVDTGTPAVGTYYNQTPPTNFYSLPNLNGSAPYFSKASYTSSNYTVGLKYQPLKQVTVRVSRATAFLPPTPSQLVTNPVQSTSTTPVDDPKTGQSRVPVYTLSGGNPDLKPQNSKSLNAGIIWEPTWKPLKGLRLDAEYYKIEQFNYIGTLTAQQIVNQESFYPDRVTRDANGIITLVDASMVNLYHRETEGWDLSASYSLKTSVGTFNLDAVESIILHLKNQYAQAQPEYDSANIPSEGGAAKYKGNATLTWEWRGWTAGWTARYFGAYKQYGVAGGPTSVQNYNGAAYTYAIIAQGRDTVPSQTYHDLFVSYSLGKQRSASGSRLRAFGAALLDGLTVQLGVHNVFDKVAPLDVEYSTNYYLSPYGDMRLRSYWLSVKKAF